MPLYGLHADRCDEQGTSRHAARTVTRLLGLNLTEMRRIDSHEVPGGQEEAMVKRKHSL